LKEINVLRFSHGKKIFLRHKHEDIILTEIKTEPLAYINHMVLYNLTRLPHITPLNYRLSGDVPHHSSKLQTFWRCIKFFNWFTNY
jgi:hypothetical protein